MGEEAAVQVAVRVRPFNKREKNFGAKRSVDMDGPRTLLYQEDADEADDDPRVFTFDYSMWSFYDFKVEKPGENPDHPTRPNVDQDYCYNLVGVKLLNYMWEGYDVCMFAYGQSGSGKSFSMTGAGPKCSQALKGIIPRIAGETFQKIEAASKEADNVSFRVTASMLEIYVDNIYDLLIPNEKYNIKTRKELSMQLDNVKGLSQLPVASEDDVTDLLVRGFSNQTKAPTGLNVDSSRGHTIFTLDMYKTIHNPKAKKKSQREQTIHTSMKLVDLAGSERTEKVLSITKEDLAALLTEKYGKPVTVSDKMMASYKAERTIEGRSINNSLTTLGNCVKQVAKLSEIEDIKLRKKKMGQIAWRSASLTRLLRSALNGKCKTIMIAAVSPSLSEYPETVSTMRYANNIKQIKSQASKQVAKLTDEQIAANRIKELEEQLAAALANGGGGGPPGEGGPAAGGGADPEEMKQMKEEMEKMEAEMAKLQAEEEAAAAHAKEMEAQMAAIKEEQLQRKAITEAGPHLLMLVDNPMTSGLIVTALAEGQIIMCGPEDQANAQLKLRGSGVRDDHCTFTNSGNLVTLTPGAKAQCLVNGEILTEPKVLTHNDGIRLAVNNYFRFIDPDILKTKTPDEQQEDDEKYTYEYLKQEATQKLLSEYDDAETEEETQRKEEIQAQLEAKEKEFATKQAELEASQKELQQELQVKIAEIEQQAALAEQEKLKEAEGADEDTKMTILAGLSAAKQKAENTKSTLRMKLLHKRINAQKALKEANVKESAELKTKLRDMSSGYDKALKEAEDQAARRKQLEAIVSQNKAEFEQKQASLEARLKVEEAETRAQLAQMKAALAEAQGDAEKERIESEQHALEKAMLEKRLTEQKYLKAEMAKAKRALREEKLAQEEEDKRDASIERKMILDELMEAQPACQQANSWARKLGLSARYAPRVTNSVTPDGLKKNVVIELTDNTGVTEIWDLLEFRETYTKLAQFYQQHNPPSRRLANPFTVSHSSLQTIGYVQAQLATLYSLIDLDDTFKIVSTTGDDVGRAVIKVGCVLPTEHQEAALSAQDMSEMPAMNYMDWTLEILRCEKLPTNHASDVRVKIEFPDWVQYTLLPEGEAASFAERMDGEYEDEYQERVNIKTGGFILTDFRPDREGELECNPILNYKRTIRVYSVNQKMLNWLEKGALIFTVVGEIPDLIGARAQGPVAPIAKLDDFDSDDEDEDDAPQSKAPFAVGDRVEGIYPPNGRKYKATVHKVSRDGAKVTLNWDDGDTCHRELPVDQIFKLGLFQVGDRVRGIYPANNKQYDATVVSISQDGSVIKVDWDDGDTRYRELPVEKVLPMNVTVAVGDSVRGIYPPSKQQYSATIADISVDGQTITLNWEDGDPNYRVLPASQVLKNGVPCDQAEATPAAPSIIRFTVGSHVKGKYPPTGTLYDATVASFSPDGSIITVNWHDGDQKHRQLPVDQVLPVPFTVGDRVQGIYPTNGNKYGATIAVVSADGFTVTLNWDDGDMRYRELPAHQVLPGSPASAPAASGGGNNAQMQQELEAARREAEAAKQEAANAQQQAAAAKKQTADAEKKAADAQRDLIEAQAKLEEARRQAAEFTAQYAKATAAKKDDDEGEANGKKSGVCAVM